MSSSTPTTRKIIALDNGGGLTFMYATDAQQADPKVRDDRDLMSK